jgi:hypothetical protein
MTLFRKEWTKKKYLFCSLLLFFADLFGKGIPCGVEFRINTNTKYSQTEPAVAPLPDGGFIVCWISMDFNLNDTGINGQLFSSDGEKIGGEFQINEYKGGYENDPVIASIADGNFMVCWDRYMDLNMFIEQVYGQFFSSNYEKIGSEFLINTATQYSDMHPEIASFPNGTFVVCWSRILSLDDGDVDVYGQMFSSENRKINSEFRINTNTKKYQVGGEVASLPNGDFVVCWVSYDLNGNSGVYGQLLSSNGDRIGSEFRISTTEGWLNEPAIASLPSGGFSVCWRRSNWDFTEDDLRGQLFASDGEKIGDEFRINVNTNIVRRLPDPPAIASLSGGGFVVCWNGYGQNDEDWDVYGQLFSSNGERNGCEFRINTYTKNAQFMQKIASLSNGGFVVCWQGEYSDGAYNEIFGKRFPGSPLIHRLKPFGLLDPLNDSSIQTVYADLKWRQPSDQAICYPWELHYTIFVDDNPDFISPQIINQDQDTSAVVRDLTPGTTYFWKVLAKNISGDSLWSSSTNAFFVSRDASGVEITESNFPAQPILHLNYPNPFNPETSIQFDMPESGVVVISVYDVHGRLVCVLLGESRTAGSYSVQWGGKDSFGNPAPSGIYVCRMEVLSSGGRRFTQSVKMGLVR